MRYFYHMLLFSALCQLPKLPKNLLRLLDHRFAVLVFLSFFLVEQDRFLAALGEAERSLVLRDQRRDLCDIELRLRVKLDPDFLGIDIHLGHIRPVCHGL